MTEENFNVIRPNIYYTETAVSNLVVFSCRRDAIAAARSISDVINDSIGELKVSAADAEVLEKGKAVPSDCYDMPLCKYLDILERMPYDACVSNASAEWFNLGHKIKAFTSEDPCLVADWYFLKKLLKDPEKSIEEKKQDRTIVIDDEATKKKWQDDFNDLSAKMPDRNATLYVIHSPTCDSDFGFLEIVPILSEDGQKIRDTRDAVVDALSGFRGPCLSYDAKGTLIQAFRLFNNIKPLVDKYGDVLCRRDWRDRLYKLDP